jgi:two-component sensor histidine kinase/CHASE3 domain sensor protein
MKDKPKNLLISLAFGLSFFLLFLSSLAAWKTGQSVRRQSQLAIHTAIVLGKSEQVVRNMIDAEVGVRRYIYTRNSQEYLELFNASKIEIRKNSADLEAMTKDNVIQKSTMLNLKSRIARNLAGLEQIVLVFKGPNPQRAKYLIELDSDKKNMDKLRDAISNIQSVEKKLFANRNAQFAIAYRNQTIFTFGALGGAILLAGATLFVINRQIQDLHDTRVELRQLNRTLENKVEKRTMELTDLAADLEQKRTEAVFERSRVELLLREINHRIGNNLATVSALLGLEASNTKNVEAKNVIESAQNRILGIAAAQRRLRFEDDMASVDARATLTAVVDDLLHTSTLISDIDLHMSLDALSLESRDITSLAIVINELVTNALKHAFTNQQPKTLSIMIRSASPGLSLTVKDNGVGFDISLLDNRNTGLGHTIIQRIARQYGGAVLWKSELGSGTSVQIDLPKMIARNNQDKAIN